MKVCVDEKWWHFETALSLALAGALGYLLIGPPTNTVKWALLAFALGFVVAYPASYLAFHNLIKRGKQSDKA